jgi:hypothetical protein
VAVLSVPPLDLTFPTLGPQLAAFIEERFVFGPGSLNAQPARLDDEKRALLYRIYEIYPQGHRLAGRRRFQRCGIELRKGVAKTEFAAWVCGAELHPEAPVRCDGFDANGHPVGRPVRSPYIPMMAVTEEQVEELAYGVLKYILENCPDGDLFDISKDRIVQVGPTGSNEGEAVAVSNSPGSRDGARTTFQHFDEPHRLFMPRMREAHETMLQNMPKRPLEDPWTFYTSTAGQPGQNSIEEDVRAEAEAINKGLVEDPSLFFFARWAGDEHKDLTTIENRVAAVSDATGPIGEWGIGQFERIAKDYDRKGIDKAYWERVWLNRWRRSGSRAFDMLKVEELKRPNNLIPLGAFVTVGFDGARFRDSTALVVTDIESGLQQMVACWERPQDVIGADGQPLSWEVPEIEVSDAIEEVMSRYEVWRMYADPPFWTETVASWSAKYPDRVIEWWTNRPRTMAYALRAYTEAIDSMAVRFGGTEEQLETLVDHLGNAGRKELRITDDEGNPLAVLVKQDGRLQDKFDAAMAGCLSWTACLDARRAGAQPTPKVGMPRRIY